MQSIFRSFVLAVSIPAGLLLTSWQNTQADDLLGIYNIAKDVDAQLKAAETRYLASLEQKPQALAALKPQISASAQTSLNISHTENTSFNDGLSNFLNLRYGLTLAKTVYHKELDIQVEQANLSVAQAKETLRTERHNLILRVAEAYFNLLNTQNDLRLARAEKQAIGQELQRIQAFFDVGKAAITDLHETKARYDLIAAQELSAESQVEVAEESLRVLTNQTHRDISGLANDLPLTRPAPETIEAWVEAALDNNPAMQSAKFNVKIAVQEVQKQRASRSPTVDLFASQDGSISRGSSKQEQLDAAIGIRVDYPIYTGGLRSSKIREAQHRFHVTQETLEQQKRQISRDTRAAYLNVISGISQVNAYKQALVSSQTRVQTTQAGFEAGTRTAVDVLEALQENFRAERDYAQARYDYLLNTLRLKQAAGTVSDQDMAQINQWLEAPETLAEGQTGTIPEEQVEVRTLPPSLTAEETAPESIEDLAIPPTPQV